MEDYKALLKEVEKNNQYLKSIKLGIYIVVVVILITFFTVTKEKPAANIPRGDVGEDIDTWLQNESNQNKIAEAIEKSFNNLNASFLKLEAGFEELQHAAEKQAAIKQLESSAQFLEGLANDEVDSQTGANKNNYDFSMFTPYSENDLAIIKDIYPDAGGAIENLIAVSNDSNAFEADLTDIRNSLKTIRIFLTNKKSLNARSVNDLNNRTKALDNLKEALYHCYIHLHPAKASEHNLPQKSLILTQIQYMIGLTGQAKVTLKYFLPEVKIDLDSLNKSGEYKEILKDRGATQIRFDERTDERIPVTDSEEEPLLWWFNNTRNGTNGFYVAFDETHYFPAKINIKSNLFTEVHWLTKHRICQDDRKNLKNNPSVLIPWYGGVIQEFPSAETFYTAPGIFLAFKEKTENEAEENKYYALFGSPSLNTASDQNVFNGSNWQAFEFDLAEIWNCDRHGKVDKWDHQRIYPPPIKKE